MASARVSGFSAAIVGSGPAGFYTAASLLALPERPIRVDMYERLPTPWGLVRTGVAPDHPKIKSISAQFETTAAHPRFRFFGNVDVGTHVTREELLGRYDFVVYAVGAPADRVLRIPGEELPGVAAAGDFVGWYNGHPEFPDVTFDLGVRHAVVIGNGNVALDVARILITSPDRLATTDIADHALDALRGSRIEDVTVIGRRGPAEASFTTPELRELAELTGAAVVIDPRDMRSIGDEDHLAHIPKRNLAVLRKYALGSAPAGGRRIRLRFLTSPVEIGGDGRVESVVVGRNQLTQDSDGTVRAVDTGEREILAAGLVLRAVGYRGVALPGVPFDSKAGVIPNRDGRVEGGDREYVAGWIKRGASGIIGTNRKCATETVHTIATDLADHPERFPVAQRHDVEHWLRQRQPALVDLRGWDAIDAAERDAGQRQGRPRVKLCTWDGLLTTALAVPV